MNMTPEEKARIAFVQHSTPGRVSVTPNVSVFAAPWNITGKNSILKEAKFIKKFKIPAKYLAKLRPKYKNFQLLEFEEYQFDTSRCYHTWYSVDLSCYPHYLWPKFINGIFQVKAPKYKKLLNSTYDIFNNKLSFKLTRQEVNDLRNLLVVNVNVLKDLVNKISDLSKITLEQRNFFLYYENNYINHTFLTELNKKIQIYDLISTDGIGLCSAELLTPKSSLKFNVLEMKYKEKLVLQLEDIRRHQKLDVKDKKIINFSILLSSKNKKKLMKKEKCPTS